MAKELVIEKSIIIHRNTQDVFEYLKYTKNQDNFSLWNMKDPAMKKTYTGTDGTVGFIYAWDSKDKNVGAGEQETINIDDGKRVDFNLRFVRPMQNTGMASFLIDKVSETQSAVKWIFRGEMKFPMSLFSFIFKGMLGKQLDKGLQNLKEVLEKQAPGS